MTVEDSDDEYKHYYDMNMLLCITCFKISSFPFTEILKKNCWSFYAFEWIKLISLSKNFEKMLNFSRAYE